MNLGALLKQNYEMHTAFKDFTSLSLDKCKNQLNQFNISYKEIAQWPLKNSKSKIVQLKNVLTESLVEIFNCLKNQVTDKYEIIFLNELQSEIKRIIESDFLIFSRRKKLDFVTRNIFRKHKNFLNELQRKKFFISCLPNETVDNILKVGSSHLKEFREKVKVGKLSREDLSFNCGPAADKITNILNNEFEKMGINDAVSEYMQQPMQVGGQAFELSVSQAQWWRNGFIGLTRTPDTLYAHLDESVGAPKSIVYLTNVTVENGPTGYYEKLYESLELNPLQELVGRILANVGSDAKSHLYNYYNKSYHQSMTSANFRKHFMLLPPELRFNSHFGWDIFPNSEAESLMKRTEIKMTGPAGTFLVFDGAKLLHRGGLVNQGDRVALQVVFGASRPQKLRKRIINQYLPF